MSTMAGQDCGLVDVPGYVVPTDPNYPHSDGKPMAESTRQWEWIVAITTGVAHVFRHAPDVFVASDLLWYPVRGDVKTCAAPDVMVVFGRPRGHRLSYLQWVEEGIAPQVVVEIRSHTNRALDMAKKLEFYDRFGAEEYYVYDPDPDAPPYFLGYARREGRLELIPDADRGWASPRLGVVFRLREDGHLELFGPDGEPFQSYDELRDRLDEERARAEVLTRDLLLEQGRLAGERRKLKAAEEAAEAAAEKAERLAARLRELGIDPEA